MVRFMSKIAKRGRNEGMCLLCLKHKIENLKILHGFPILHHYKNLKKLYALTSEYQSRRSTERMRN